MTDFIAHVMEEGKPSNWFRHEFKAKDYAEAIEFARTGIVQAYKDEKKSEVRNTIITLLLLNFDVPPKSWRLKMPSEEIEECPVPCPQCSGVGGVDSGGSDPQGHPIMVECPSCHPKPDVQASYSEIIGDMEKRNNHRPECRCDKCYADLMERASRGTEANSFKDALNSLQDNVWASMGRYSTKLGWGLTGIQPECWACLDSAVEELVQARQARLWVKQLLADLPTKRDWLNPDIERGLKEWVE